VHCREQEWFCFNNEGTLRRRRKKDEGIKGMMRKMKGFYDLLELENKNKNNIF